jgi:hypothetical protein
MPQAERAERLAQLRTGVEREDIGWWLRGQMEDMARIGARRLKLVSPRHRLPAR